MLYTLNNDFSGHVDVSGVLKADMFIIGQAYRNRQTFLDSLPLMHSSSTPLVTSEGAESQWNTCAYISSISTCILCLLLFGESNLFLV